MNKKKTSQSGVALLMTLGILALLSILGVAYSTNMRLMESTTRDFVHEMRARYLAEGGIEYAIAELKEDARNNFTYDGIQTWTNDELSLSSIEISRETDTKGTLQIKAIDTARQININNANEALLRCLPDIGSGIASDIITMRNRMPDNKFPTKQSICLSGGLGDPNETTSRYNRIKDYITTDTYIDPNTQDSGGNAEARSAININTVDASILEDMLDVVTGVGSAYAYRAATALMSNRSIDSWTEFDEVIDNADISSTAKDNIKDAFNPNRWKPDDNIPTEFCFHSGGTYEITATGTITKNDQTLAKKTVTGTVKIFDLLNQTTTEQFSGDDIDQEPPYQRITWKDSCPVNSNDIWTLTASADPDYTPTREYYTVRDSLKLGYWDDFSDSGYSDANWSVEPYSTARYSIGDYARHTGCIRLNTWAVVSLFPRSESVSDRWSFAGQDHYIHAQMWDVRQARRSDYAAVLFRAVRGRGYGFDSSVVHIYNYYAAGDPLRRDRFAIWLSPAIQRARRVSNKPGSIWSVFEIWETSGSVWAQESYEGMVNYVNAGPVLYRDRPLVRLYNGQPNVCAYDNIRVIGTEGNYTSFPLIPENYPVDWGTVYFTAFESESAEESRRRYGVGVSVKLQIGADGFSSTIDSPGGAISGGNSNSIRYRAILETTSRVRDQRPETPVLEDVWITYLPKTKVLYWREGVTE